MDLPGQLSACKGRIGSMRALIHEANTRGSKSFEAEDLLLHESELLQKLEELLRGGDHLSSSPQIAMSARQLIDGAAFGPDALKAIGQAFDEAWAEIAGNFGNVPIDIDNARYRLANALLSVPCEDSRNVEVPKRAALQWRSITGPDKIPHYISVGP
jgi:hypothetical protein